LNRAARFFELPRLIPVLLVTLLTVSACAVSNVRTAPDSNQNPTFIPPTLAPTPLPPTPTPTNPPSLETTSAPPKCTDVLTYIADITVPDGTIVAPESSIDKRWQVQNSGTCNWGDGYKIKLLRGDPMGVPKEQALVPSRSNTQAEIRILFTAPKNPQKYSGVWQAYNPDDEPFGDPFYIEIVVKK
jgi:hypothetical protein